MSDEIARLLTELREKVILLENDFRHHSKDYQKDRENQKWIYRIVVAGGASLVLKSVYDFVTNGGLNVVQ